jgi:uncharacterized protein DUF5946
MAPLVPCPGCGGLFPDASGPTHRYLESSPGCAEAAGKVFALHYSDFQMFADVYRLANDAYAVQHPGRPSPPAIRSVGVHLARLCLMFEHGLPVQRANEAAVAVSKRKNEFVWLPPPASLGKITVADFSPDLSAVDHKALVRRWAREAWDAWGPHHESIRRWLPAQFQVEASRRTRG